ncbi:MAG TPA: tetratricopeptide repeat protein [Allosphingosinicella sp.]|jgi:TPR repeat protein
MKAILYLLAPLVLVAGIGSCAAAAEPSVQTRLEALAARGNGQALYHLGMMHHLGLDGAAKDSRLAFGLFTKSAAAGDPLGAYKVGCFYAGQGEGVPADPGLALKYKLIAAQAGYSLAQSDVARIYFERGDLEAALRWLQSAADQGDFGAMMAFAGLHAGGNGVARDGSKQYAYTKLAIQLIEAETEKLPGDWQQELRNEFSAEERRKGEEIVRAWKPLPTPLTRLADAGHGAATELLGKTGR